ncbi:uncharacterized protein F4807DRAFT_460370 [Annulohypoxylon truncatum]|uniref:uncharacterized protein n=1 Tax=Annulohypoxylon truncatum TaxID=327061 RepID=UPI0020078E82|nr:uncharacterized protein F4807DRAFT_460370 [Annulohypoxylon truncatum]KAI1209621.1 hypothetical protein F4807DRAFT_460370 [Annulohypoxylon truncatum]
MAEALGVAASGIAIAQISAQVGGAVFKLKQLWNEVKDVPDDIADLIEQLDCLSPVVWEVENNFNQGSLPSIFWDQLASNSATTYCRKALQNLTTMADELNLQIDNARKGHRKITAFKVLLKKDSLKRLERRLENAIRMLTLAQQSYLVALTRVQPDIIVARFTTHKLNENRTQIQSDSEPTTEPGKGEILTRRQKWPHRNGTAAQPRCDRLSKSTKPGIFGHISVNRFVSGYGILLQPPTWLSWRSWELHSIRAHGDWQWNLRSYYIIPMHHRALDVLGNGSPRDVQKLFDTRLLSPYAGDQWGFTPLHRAMNYGNFQVVRYLLEDVGMNPLDRDNRGRYPADMLSLWQPKEKFTELLSDKMLAKKSLIFSRLNYLEYDDNEEIQISHTECNCCVRAKSVELYKMLLPYQCPSHANTSLRSRINAAGLTLTESIYEDSFSPEVVKLILEPEWSTNPQAIYSNTPNPLIRSIAFKMGEGHFDRHAQDWFTFAIDVVRLTPDLHTTYLHEDPFLYNVFLVPGNTALMSLATGLFWYIARRVPWCYFPAEFAEVLISWLEVLKRAGIDLDVYGYREHEIFVKNDQHFFDLRSYFQPSFSAFYLVDFKFGPEPEDWEFYWAEPTDEFAGDFWDLIENPPLHIPGSWVD